MTVSSFAIWVEFELVPDARDAFLCLVTANAQNSVMLEPGCLRFDVLTTDEDRRIRLYEVYSDRAAFDQHLESDHFGIFAEKTRDMVIAKKITSFDALTCGAVKEPVHAVLPL